MSVSDNLALQIFECFPCSLPWPELWGTKNKSPPATHQRSQSRAGDKTRHNVHSPQIRRDGSWASSHCTMWPPSSTTLLTESHQICYHIFIFINKYALTATKKRKLSVRIQSEPKAGIHSQGMTLVKGRSNAEQRQQKVPEGTPSLSKG